MSVLQQIEELKDEALGELDSIGVIKGLESWRVKYLGKKSKLIEVLRGLSKLPLDERKAFGAGANRLKADLENSLSQKEYSLGKQLAASTKEEHLDISLPGHPLPVGRLHPITQVINEINDIFISMGFQVVEGPEVEWDYYNFEALNIPDEHPARDTMATLWIDSKAEAGERSMLLRTHTSPMQIRVMEKVRPPLSE